MPHHSDDAKIKLFTPIFIDFLEQKFFIRETEQGFECKDYDYAQLVNALPSIYKDMQLILWGLQYLESKGVIQQILSSNTDSIRWRVTDEAINDRINSKASNDLNRRVDRAIKQRTLDQLDASLEDRPLIKAQIESTIETNGFVKKAGTWNIRLFWVTLVIAIGTIATPLFTYISDSEKNNLRQQLQYKDSQISQLKMLLSQKAIVPPPQKSAKDSFYQKRH